MAIALVQKSAAWTITGINTLPGNSTAGNLLVACLRNGGGITPPSGWTRATAADDIVTIYYYENTIGGQSSFTFTNAIDTYVMEFSGVSTSSSLDTVSTKAAAASSPITATTTGNVSNNNSLGVGMGFSDETKAGTTTMGAGTGWTNASDNGATSATMHDIATYRTDAASGSTLAETFSSTTMNLSALSGIIAVFKPVGAAPPPSPGNTTQFFNLLGVGT